jgi:hypothetical protein
MRVPALLFRIAERIATLAPILLLSCALSACLGAARDQNETIPAGAPSPTVTGVDDAPQPVETGPVDTGLTETSPTETSRDQVVISPDAPVETPALKYHPGHYIAMNGFDGQDAMLLAVQPGVRGAHKRYPWRELEPEPGVYDFSIVAADLQLMADHGMQLVVMIEDKTFTDARPTPPYLWETHTLPNNAGGHTAKRWDPYVVERLSRLLAELGARFDEHPALEGIALQESAMSLSQDVKNAHGYTPEAYRDALIEILSNARAAMPRSQVFWYMNFLDGGQAYIGEIAAAAAQARIAMGGPDVLPDSWPLQRHAYPYYEAFAGRMVLFGSLQYDSYAHQRASPQSGAGGIYWTLPELFLFARDRLHANYLFWTRKPRPNPADSYDWRDALAVIREHPGFN